MIRAAAGFSGFCVRFLVFGVIVDDDADVLQFFDLVGVHGVIPEVHLNEHDALLELRDGLDLIIVGVDEVDGEVAHKAGQIRDLVVADIDVPERRIGVHSREDGDLVVAHVEVDQLPELGNDGDIRDRVERQVQRLQRRAGGDDGDTRDLVACSF